MESDEKFEKILRARDIIPSSHSSAAKNKTSVPHFDLATEIMAQQRKISSARRKKTDGKTPQEINKQKIEPSAENTSFPESFDESVIAEIVRKDIQRMLSSKKNSKI